MLINRTIRPKNKRYLAPQKTEGLYEGCGEVAPQPPFDKPWQCTRAPGHSGDHAAHSGFFGPGKPVMVARWPAETGDE